MIKHIVEVMNLENIFKNKLKDLKVILITNETKPQESNRSDKWIKWTKSITGMKWNYVIGKY